MPDKSNLRWKAFFVEHAVYHSEKSMGQQVEAHFSQGREKRMLSYLETLSVKSKEFRLYF